MPRTHFYHTVWKKNATTGSVEPLAGVECDPRNVGANGSIGVDTVPVFTSRTGVTEPASMLTNSNGVISFFCDPGEYYMLFSDTIIPARISAFSVGHSGVNGADTGIDMDQLPTELQDQLDGLTENIAALEASLEAFEARMFQPGDVIAWAGSGGKTGWFIMDGSVMDRTTYPLLFAKIGTVYNTGGETGAQFRIPDMRGRTIFGEDESDLRIDLANLRGNTGGSEFITSSQNRLPNNIPWGDDIPANTLIDSGGGGTTYAVPALEPPTAWDHGSGSPAPNMPPYMIMNWLIKHDEDD